MWPCFDTFVTLTATIRPVKLLATTAAGAVLAAVLLLAACDSSSADGEAAAPANLKADRFDSAAAWRLLRYQVELGPRPAGSEPSRRLARRLRRLLPRGRFQQVPGGLRNVVGTVPGREPGYVVRGRPLRHQGRPGVRRSERRRVRHRHRDGARAHDPAAPPHDPLHPLRRRGEPARLAANFFRDGLRGSKVAAARYRDARAMVLLDFVGEKRLRIPREGYSNEELWGQLRRAAREVGAGAVFPGGLQGSIQDDHLPFLQEGVPAIDLIDFDFSCFHQPCDDLSVVSERSLDAVGETVLRLLASL